MIHQYILPALILVIVASLGWSAWKLRDRFVILGEFITFLRERKLWWIMPLVMMFALVGLFVVIAGQSTIAAFIYPLF